MTINPANQSSYEFGEFRVDLAERVLMRDGELETGSDLRRECGLAAVIAARVRVARLDGLLAKTSSCF